MEGERDAAIRTVPRFAARAAQERSRESATVEKQNGLLVFLEPARDRRAQLFGENRGDFFLPPREPQIDDPHQRHLAIVHALRQIQQAIFPLNGVVITLERRRGGPEQNDALLHLRAHDRDVARVIARRFLLLVGGLVLFIDDDQPEIFERSKHSAARADHDPRPTGLNLVPFIVPLAFGQMAVQNRDRVLRFGKTALESLHGLRRERNFRNEHDGGFPARQGRADRLQINFRLSAPGHAMQQNRLRIFRRRQRFFDRAQGQTFAPGSA